MPQLRPVIGLVVALLLLSAPASAQAPASRDGKPGGVLKLVPDSKDRRRKHIELDLEAFKRSGSQIRALEKAMIDYYGSSVYKLKRDKPN